METIIESLRLLAVEIPRKNPVQEFNSCTARRDAAKVGRYGDKKLLCAMITLDSEKIEAVKWNCVGAPYRHGDLVNVKEHMTRLHYDNFFIIQQ
ncbi:MAG: hypothetical protein WAO19_00685 [Candidatus Kryptoniota bacterium]